MDQAVSVGNIYEDLDLTRPARSLKVVEVTGAVAHVINLKTEKMTRIRVDRLRPRSNGSHGYRLVEAPLHDQEPSGG